MTSTQRQAIYQQELRAAFERMTPNCPGGRFSGAQVASAKGIARRRTIAIAEGSR